MTFDRDAPCPLLVFDQLVTLAGYATSTVSQSSTCHSRLPPTVYELYVTTFSSIQAVPPNLTVIASLDGAHSVWLTGLSEAPSDSI